MPVPYDYYRIFYYVAQYRSFTRAAEVLHGSQPNITRTINLLEQELGCRLFEQRLRPFQDLLVAGPEYAHLAGRPLTYAQLAGLPLICLGQDSSTFAFYARLFARQGAVLEPDVQTATTDQLVPLVRYGLGLAFVPEDFARDALAKGEVVRLTLQTPPPLRYISLVKDKSRPLSVAAMELERMLRAASQN